MWNRVDYAQDYMACRVIGRRDRKAQVDGD